MLAWSALAMDACDLIEATVIVAPPGEEARAKEVADALGRKVKAVVTGGAERQDSLGAGLDAIAGYQEGDALAVVHDAARPLVTPEDVARVVVGGRRRGAAILAVPVKDTIKEVDERDRIIATPDRERLWIAQTPQVARASLLREGLAKARAEGRQCSDEASLLEALGVEVLVVIGDCENLKVTTGPDIIMAESLLRRRGAGK